MSSLQEELEAAGIKTIGAVENTPFEKEPITIDAFNGHKLDEEVGAVLVGLDQDSTYTKLCLASLYI